MIVVAVALSAVILLAMRPYFSLPDDALVAFVRRDCSPSRALVRHVQAHGSDRILFVPVDLEESEWRTSVCRRTMEQLSRRGRLWLAVVPDSLACQYLAEDGLRWWHENSEGYTPVWVRDGEVIARGIRTEVMERLGVVDIWVGLVPDDQMQPPRAI
jgi:hypothetical protein